MYYNPKPYQYDYQFTNPLIPQYQHNQSTYAIVHGLSDARSYPVVPNTTCILFDDEKSEFYKKTVDSMGVVDLRLFEYNEKAIETPAPAIASTADKAELDAIKAELNALKAQIEQTHTKKKEKGDAIDF